MSGAEEKRGRKLVLGGRLLGQKGRPEVQCPLDGSDKDLGWCRERALSDILPFRLVLVGTGGLGSHSL